MRPPILCIISSKLERTFIPTTGDLPVKRIVWLMLALLLAPLPGPALAQPALVAAPPAALRYLWPSNGAQFVPPGATLALRLDGPIDPQKLSAAPFHLVGAS